MKKILIISPHFPPSNLTAVHRARIFANHLQEFGWKPIILTVHEDDYEEKPDWDLHRLLPEDLRIEKVNAMQVTKPRIIGDIGLRAFRSIFRKAKDLIKMERIDFLYITIPSFYGALWGRWLHWAAGIPYGIDYIDPWVHDFSGSRKFLSRAWMATKIAGFLEPIAVKKASLITGVAEQYYQGVIDRNPHLKKDCLFAAMPYGGELSDHKAVERMNLSSYLFEQKEGIIQLIYAGAMLPKAYSVLEEFFKSIRKDPGIFQNVELHFIGTGKNPGDKEGYNIRPYAERYGLWEQQIYEYPARISYLDVLVHLSASDGVFVLGSTEPHYTPSKVYQAVLAKKPVFAILHRASTAVDVIRLSNTGVVLDFNGERDLNRVGEIFADSFEEYLSFMKMYCSEEVDWSYFEEFSAREITGKLVEKLDLVIEKGRDKNET